jgi:Zn-dependent membrane protease YugP
MLMYLAFIAPAMLLAIWAQYRVRSTYTEASKIPAAAGLTGAQAAAEVMRAAGVSGVGIEPVDGELSDHYDPRAKVLRLSSGVYGSRSLAALGIAAHEAGHAIQDAHQYSPLVIRNLMVPAASLGSNLSWIIILIGAVMSSMQLTVAFQLVNLPVEFDASRRARESLVMTGLISQTEDREVGKVLNAAALTYVAATLSSVMTLLYFLFQYGLLGGRGSEE